MDATSNVGGRGELCEVPVTWDDDDICRGSGLFQLCAPPLAGDDVGAATDDEERHPEEGHPLIEAIAEHMADLSGVPEGPAPQIITEHHDIEGERFPQKIGHEQEHLSAQAAMSTVGHRSADDHRGCPLGMLQGEFDSPLGTHGMSDENPAGHPQILEHGRERVRYLSDIRRPGGFGEAAEAGKIDRVHVPVCREFAMESREVLV
ncbi:hypothetical protein ABC271_12200 [Microbacterium sp. 1P10AE]